MSVLSDSASSASLRDDAHSPPPPTDGTPADGVAPEAAAAEPDELPARRTFEPSSPEYEPEPEPEVKRRRGEDALRLYDPAQPSTLEEAPRVLLMPTSASHNGFLPGAPRTVVSVLLCERLMRVSDSPCDTQSVRTITLGPDATSDEVSVLDLSLRGEIADDVVSRFSRPFRPSAAM